MTTAELLAALTAAQTGEPAQSVESAIAVYLGAKAQMDALAASDDGIARLLAPHRKATERAGTMRIVAAK